MYAKPPFGGPAQVLAYLGRYTHRIGLSEARLITVDEARVRFRVRRGADRSERKVLTLPGPEFLHRFLQHVLPAGFQRLRHYGLTASRCKQAKLSVCRQQLQVAAPEPKAPKRSTSSGGASPTSTSIAAPTAGAPCTPSPPCRRCVARHDAPPRHHPHVPKAGRDRLRPGCAPTEN